MHNKKRPSPGSVTFAKSFLRSANIITAVSSDKRTSLKDPTNAAIDTSNGYEILRFVDQWLGFSTGLFATNISYQAGGMLHQIQHATA